MTFNEGMQIDTSTASSSGGGGMGMAVGGGGLGLIILLGALFLGVDPGRVMPQQQTNTGGYSAPGFDLSQCKTAPTPTSTCSAAWSPPGTRWTRCGIS